MVTSREKDLLRVALSRNELTIRDFKIGFSQNYTKGVMERFLLMGLIEQHVGDKFKINKEKIEEILK